jgi:hypothetical protein
MIKFENVLSLGLLNNNLCPSVCVPVNCLQSPNGESISGNPPPNPQKENLWTCVVHVAPPHWLMIFAASNYQES